MKNLVKIATVCMMVCSSISVSMAQTSAGTFALGGNVTYTGTHDQGSGAGDPQRSTNFTFMPSLGYFVTDGLLVGGELVVAVLKDEYNGNNEYRQNVFGVGPFLRYYRFTKNSQFAFVGDFGVNYGAAKSRYNDNDPSKSSRFNLYITPGFTWFPTSHWGIDLKVNLFTYTSYDPDKDGDDDKESTITFGLNTFSPSLGVRYHFGK
ncbi:outer membrane beta-barrel protein [Chryseolinea sp. T2]|uniref:outer membrane beta-barrel protein n=1 Tax=Chryseolinea sp. T2 TaxID=3129255 RepID=UPI0030776321